MIDTFEAAKVGTFFELRKKNKKQNAIFFVFVLNLLNFAQKY